jgi:ArsR family transcriptional regulator
MKSIAERFRLLGDEARLRILWLIGQERLNVTELTSILGIAQSGVSRHLRLLKEGGLLQETRESGYTWFCAREIPELARFGKASIRKEDRARLQEILRKREEDFLPDRREDYEFVPGRSWTAWARALGHLLPPLCVADLASGEGYLSIEIAQWAKKVYAVDRSSRSLSRAKERAKQAGVSHISYKRGEIEKIPLESRSVDVAVFSQSLRHAKDPSRALREAQRILVPGGSVLLLELRKHREEWVQDRLGDQWLGFGEKELGSLLRKAGFNQVKSQSGSHRRGDPFKVMVVSARRALD